MNESAIIQDFEKPSPRKVCRKKDSPEEGAGFNPWDVFSDYGGCCSIFLGSLLLLALIPAIRESALIAAALFATPVGLLFLLFLIYAVSSSWRDRRLTQYGEAVIGRVTRLQSIQEVGEIQSTRVILEYQFRTRSGLELDAKRQSVAGLYTALVRESDADHQERPVVIIYLPDNPKENEPYNSLSYRICE